MIGRGAEGPDAAPRRDEHAAQRGPSAIPWEMGELAQVSPERADGEELTDLVRILAAVGVRREEEHPLTFDQAPGAVATG